MEPPFAVEQRTLSCSTLFDQPSSLSLPPCSTSRDQCKMAMGRLRQRLNRKTSEATEAWAREQDMQERLKLMEAKVDL